MGFRGAQHPPGAAQQELGADPEGHEVTLAATSVTSSTATQGQSQAGPSTLTSGRRGRWGRNRWVERIRTALQSQRSCPHSMKTVCIGFGHPRIAILPPFWCGLGRPKLNIGKAMGLNVDHEPEETAPPFGPPGGSTLSKCFDKLGWNNLILCPRCHSAPTPARCTSKPVAAGIPSWMT